MSTAPWYVTIAALREYMAMAGYRGELEDDNPDFRAAERELLDLISSDRVRDTGRRSDSGAETWRTGRIRLARLPRSVILELTVMPGPRAEGPLPQLLRVRRKA